MKILLALIKNSEGTLFSKTVKDITFAEFASPFWIYETCPIVQSKLLRGGSITKGYCLNCRTLMEDKIVSEFGKRKMKSISPDDVEKWLLENTSG